MSIKDKLDTGKTPEYKKLSLEILKKALGDLFYNKRKVQLRFYGTEEEVNRKISSFKKMIEKDGKPLPPSKRE